jgi:hypothetical protein
LPHAGESKEFFGAHHRILRPGLIFDLVVKIIDLQIRMRRREVSGTLQIVEVVADLCGREDALDFCEMMPTSRPLSTTGIRRSWLWDMASSALCRSS